MNTNRFYKLTQSEKNYLESMLDRWSDTSDVPEIHRTIMDRMFQPALLLNGMTVVEEDSIVEEVSNPFSRVVDDTYLQQIEAIQNNEGPILEYTPMPDLRPKHLRQSSHLVIDLEGEDNIDFFTPDPNTVYNEESFVDSIQTKSQQVWRG